jgi:DNA mismatch repair ATPase MutS
VPRANQYQSGFPFFQLDRFLKILVQDLSKFVAISEEFANNASGKVKSGGLLFDRKVARIITPGTLIDEKFMDPYENNFLLALYPTSQDASLKDHSKEVPVELLKGTTHPSHLSQAVGLAWLDLSTGDFFTQSIHLGTLPSAIARIGAREIVLRKGLEKNVEDDVLSLLHQERHLVTYHPAQSKELSYSSWASMLESPLPAETESNFTPEELSAGSLLLAYVSERLQGLGIKLQPPVRRFDTETMGIDRNSMRGLEVLETSRDGVGGGKGSLLHTVRRTVTKSGTRLLKNWIGKSSEPFRYQSSSNWTHLRFLARS